MAKDGKRGAANERKSRVARGRGRARSQKVGLHVMECTRDETAKDLHALK